MIKVKYIGHSDDSKKQELLVKITCPSYLRSQIEVCNSSTLNRTFNLKDTNNIYIPEKYRNTSYSKKGSSDEAVCVEHQEALKQEVREHHEAGIKLYEDMLVMGVCKEQAIGVLPQDTIVDFWMTADLEDWVDFILESSTIKTQYEIQHISLEIQDIINSKFK
ncbi:MAG: hypothetical protein COB41_00545 [Proteobacteria bacterium]|nr:MAG: hypothetical protein COB41_00545 [Pseudomonadota bacterium]